MKMSVDRARRPWALRTATLAAVALCALLAQPHVGAAVRPSQTIEAELLDDAYSPEAQDWIIQHRRWAQAAPAADAGTIGATDDVQQALVSLALVPPPEAERHAGPCEPPAAPDACPARGRPMRLRQTRARGPSSLSHNTPANAPQAAAHDPRAGV